MILFDSFTIGTENNEVSFNDDSTTPYFRARSFNPSRRDLKEFEGQLPEGSGINDTQSYVNKMYILIDGTMYPDDENDYHDGMEQLRKLSSLDVEQSDSLSDVGYVPIRFSDAVRKQIFVKVLYVDMPQSTRGGLKQQFRLLCKVKYPAIYSVNSHSSNLTVSAVAQLGGAAIPAYIPMTISSPLGGSTTFPMEFPVVFGASASQGAGPIINEGDLPSYPTISIYGPLSKPRVTNVSTGEFIELDINLASASESATITYDQDSLSVTSNNTNVYGKLTTGSTLFKLKPGENNLLFSGSSVGTSANVTVTWFDTWPLS